MKTIFEVHRTLLKAICHPFLPMSITLFFEDGGRGVKCHMKVLSFVRDVRDFIWEMTPKNKHHADTESFPVTQIFV